MGKPSFKSKKEQKSVEFVLPDSGLKVVMKEWTVDNMRQLALQKPKEAVYVDLNLLTYSLCCTFDGEGVNVDDMNEISVDDYSELTRQYMALDDTGEVTKNDTASEK